MLSLLKNAQVLLCVSFPSPLNSQFTTLQHDLSEKNLEPTPEDIFPTKCLMLGWIWVVCGPAVSILTLCVSCAGMHQYAYTLASGSWFYFFLVLFFLPVHGIPCTCIRPYRELASVSALLPFVYHTLLHILFSLWFVQPFSFCPISRYIIQVAHIWMLLLGAWKVKKVVCPWQLLLL